MSLSLSIAILRQLQAKPGAVRCPANAGSCKHCGRLPGISQHCRLMTASRRMPARASTAVARPAIAQKIQGLPPIIRQTLGMFVIHKLLSLRYNYPPIFLPHKRTGSGFLSQKPLPVPEAPGKRPFFHLGIPGFLLQLPLPE